jgi:hypothetical protein
MWYMGKHLGGRRDSLVLFVLSVPRRSLLGLDGGALRGALVAGGP